LSRKARNFFQSLTLGHITKTLNQIIFFSLHQNQNIFFSSLGLNCITDEIENELDIYFKMLVILYADDTVLFADSAVEMQIQLDNFSF
jgi:hypothetical protein